MFFLSPMMHQKIKALRTAANLSQEELANAMGISRVAVSQIEL
ncbi:MAG: helix-turn-helix transcriptional regulator [bacterium]